ncbi:uncharacterized protein LOC131072795 isoform X2 [Cryptomeria japonica]|uniref:uncharacterized protein LOC131072795 isoform X2 n=1 Tax=Cryptomeria japonica TaxID=3369 RepID=UPI0027DA2F2F|nr:uncharacterized protein LOC131072795 isoform X2 [Cryptomeria japonica]
MAATSLFISNSCSPHLFSQRKQTLSSKSYLHGCPTSIPLSSSSTCFTTHKLHYCYAPKTSSLKSYNFTKILAPPVKGVESSILQSSQDEEPSAAAIVDSFYAAINRKDFTLLSNLLAEDCILHRTLFSEPFEGKERVMKLIRDSVDPMDSETRFVIDETIEGTPNKVGKIWHLEQKRADFIFDRGFSFHSCKSYQGKLLISDIEVFINSIQLDILYSAINEVLTLLICVQITDFCGGLHKKNRGSCDTHKSSKTGFYEGPKRSNGGFYEGPKRSNEGVSISTYKNGNKKQATCP